MLVQVGRGPRLELDAVGREEQRGAAVGARASHPQTLLGRCGRIQRTEMAEVLMDSVEHNYRTGITHGAHDISRARQAIDVLEHWAASNRRELTTSRAYPRRIVTPSRYRSPWGTAS